jgi:hypothetical protein
MRVEPLANALASRGWSVWWDRAILIGKNYREVITAALKSAKCIIVVWSKNSVSSSWVIDEANVGINNNKVLLPVLIEDVQVPLGFGEIQSANLIDWQGSLSHSEFEQLMKAISNILRSSSKKSKKKAAKTKRTSPPTGKSLDSSNNFIEKASVAY